MRIIRFTPLFIAFYALFCQPLFAQTDPPKDEFEEFRNMGRTTPGQKPAATSTNHSHAPAEPQGPVVTVKEVHIGMPKDLFDAPLLLPQYEYIEEEPFANDPAQLKNIQSMNSRMTSENKALRSYYTNYKGPSKIVLFEDYETFYKEGHKYVLDFFWMPKQMEAPEQRAMVPFFVRAANLNQALVELRPQFNIYFYIRNLQTEEAYILKEFKGYKPFEFYKGIEEFTKLISQDVARANR